MKISASNIDKDFIGNINTAIIKQNGLTRKLFLDMIHNFKKFIVKRNKNKKNLVKYKVSIACENAYKTKCDCFLGKH